MLVHGIAVHGKQHNYLEDAGINPALFAGDCSGKCCLLSLMNDPREWRHSVEY